MRRPSLLAIPVLAVLVGSGYALAAGLPGIPKAFQPYKTWRKVNAKPIPPRPRTAHPGNPKNVYASKRPLRGRYPAGTLIVKEGITTAAGRRFVSLIATMRKARGLDPEHGDWQFIEWSRSSPRDRFREVARDAVCWGCHARARATDWVFTTR